MVARRSATSTLAAQTSRSFWSDLACWLSSSRSALSLASSASTASRPARISSRFRFSCTGILLRSISGSAPDNGRGNDRGRADDTLGTDAPGEIAAQVVVVLGQAGGLLLDGGVGGQPEGDALAEQDGLLVGDLVRPRLLLGLAGLGEEGAGDLAGGLPGDGEDDLAILHQVDLAVILADGHTCHSSSAQ